MKAKQGLVAVLVIGGAVMATRGCVGGCLSSGGDPDDKLAGQFEDLCKIAKVGIKDPVKGVRKLGRYHVEHTGDMMKNFGDTFAMIEMIRDDAKHDARARQARATMLAPLAACEETWQKFGDAIEGNEEALTMMNDAAVRLNRTIEIILGPGNWTFRDLPSQLQRVLSTTLH